MESEIIQEGKDPKQVMRDLSFFFQDFDREMLKIAYNYAKYLEHCKQNNLKLETAFDQFLVKMDRRYHAQSTETSQAGSEQTVIEEPSFLESTTTFVDSDLNQRELDRQKYDEMMGKLQHTRVGVVNEGPAMIEVDGHMITLAELYDKEQKIIQALTDLTDSVHVRNLYNDNMEDTFSGLLKAILTSINELSEKYTNLVENVDELNGRLEDLEIKTLNNVARMLKKAANNEDNSPVSNNLEIDSEQKLVVESETTTPLKESAEMVVGREELLVGDEKFQIGEEVFFEEALWTIVQAAKVANSGSGEQEIRLKLRNNITEEECWVGFDEIDK